MDARTYIEENASAFFTDLKEWLAIPSISADPARRDDVRRSAEWLAARLSATGFPVTEIWETGGPASDGQPAVFAEWPAADPAAPTVLIYGHHDVQPIDPLAEWHSPPFEPVEQDGQILARGASDDKGQVLFHALGVSATLAASGSDAPPVTLKLLVEGEEESGSPHFADLLHRERDRLGCDLIVISDTTMWSRDVPSMCIGMRGLVDAQLDLTGPVRDLHSGSFGGAVPNPAQALAQLLDGLHDDAGRVTLPRFYDRVLPLSDEEREMFARLPFDEKAWLAEAGESRAATGEAGFSTLERIWTPADRRDQRPVGRPHRSRHQDDHPAGSTRQAVLPAGRRPGPGRRDRGPAGVRGRPHATRGRGQGDLRRSRRAPVPFPGRLPSRAGRPPGAGPGLRPRRPVHR